ncbi:MAG: TIGR01906 family membrane protein [Clostridiales bacterium]|nr:TIGR01906 family membrane protein [Clostridiales bacterium]
MKYLHNTLGILSAFALMITLLITSVEAVCYWTPGYYEKEYEKYQVLDDVHMEMEDLLDVTEEMMAYLRGEREDLHIPTIVDGEPREFFNEREIAHMEDVQGLFLAALTIRRICLALIVICVALLFALKADVKQILPKMLCVGTVIFFVILAVLTGIIASDFSKYFVVFHHIFFDNDLWLLDPATDLLINIVPEPFFMDTAARIGATYGISVVIVFVVCLLLIRRQKKSAGEL